MGKNYSIMEIAQKYRMDPQELYDVNSKKFEESYAFWKNPPEGLVSFHSIPEGMPLNHPDVDRRFIAPGKIESVHLTGNNQDNTHTTPSNQTQQNTNNQADCTTPPWMTLAINQAHEIGGKDQTLVDATIRKYHKSATAKRDKDGGYLGSATGTGLKGAGDAWCASFVSWALNESGIDKAVSSPGSRFFRDESDGLVYPNSREGAEFGKGLEPIPKGEEKLGDIAVWADLNKYGEQKGSGHVSFVFGKDKEGNTLFLGGNQGKTLGVRAYPTEDIPNRAFVGYFRPEEVQNAHTTCDLTQYSTVALANKDAIGIEMEIGPGT